MAELRAIFLLACTIGFHVSHGALRLSQLDEVPVDVIPLDKFTDQPMNVSLDFKLLNIAEADTDRDQVEVILWTQVGWKVPLYTSVFVGGTTDQMSLPSTKVWTPDIAFYNAIAAPELLSPDRVAIFSDGSVIYVPSKKVRFSCDLKDLAAEQGATCRIKVGSWTYHNKQLALTNPAQEVNIAEYFDSPKFEILSATQNLNHMKYSCCENLYDDVEITFTFRKK